MPAPARPVSDRKYADLVAVELNTPLLHMLHKLHELHRLRPGCATFLASTTRCNSCWITHLLTMSHATIAPVKGPLLATIRGSGLAGENLERSEWK